MGSNKLYNTILLKAKKRDETVLEFVTKAVALLFCVIAVVFGVVFFIFQMITFARCLNEYPNKKDKCFNGLFYFACALFLSNILIWIFVSRCCFKCFCHGCCHRWRNYQFRTTLKRLESHPLTKKLKLDENTAVVKHLETLMKDTWMYSDHLGSDAKSLHQIEHKSVQIRHIFQIENAEHAVRYLSRHLHTFDSYELPEQLRKNPIKTKTVPTHQQRVLSEVSLTLLDVFKGPLESFEEQNSAEGTTVAQVHMTRDNPHWRKASLQIDMMEKYKTTNFMFDLKRRMSSISSLSKHKRSMSVTSYRGIYPGQNDDSTVFGCSYMKRKDATIRMSDCLSEAAKTTASTPMPSEPGSPLSMKNAGVFFNFSSDEEEEGVRVGCEDAVVIEMNSIQSAETIVNEISEIPLGVEDNRKTSHNAGHTNDAAEPARLIGKSAKNGHKVKRPKRKHKNMEALEIKSGITNAGEAFLFHGTRLKNVISIIENGFDINHSKSGLYGKGIYLAESSQKADQYSDNPSHRRTMFLPMFVVRTSLGKVGVHDPSSTLNDSVHSGNDSVVVEDTVVAGQNKRFREFIKRDVTQCYPEFLIIYDRV